MDKTKITNTTNLVNDKSKHYKEFKKDNTVVMDNRLITSRHNMSRNELLAFKHIISQVDTKSKSKVVHSKKSEIVKYIFPNTEKLKTNDIHNQYYKDCKKYCLSLVKIDIHIKEPNKKKTTAYNLISMVEWNDESNIVTIEFADRMLPLIYELKKNFTQAAAYYFPKLKSKYTIRMYDYCKAHLHPNNKCSYTWEESVSTLKHMLDIEKKYQQYRDFNQAVLKKPQQGINEHTDIHMEYKTLKKSGDGKTITHILFTAKNKYKKTQREIDANKKLWNETKPKPEKVIPIKKISQQSTTTLNEIAPPTEGPGRDFLNSVAAIKTISVDELVKVKPKTSNTIEEIHQQETKQPDKKTDEVPVKKPSLWNKLKSIFKH